MADELRLPSEQLKLTRGTVIIVPVSGLHRIVASTVAYAKTISPNVIAFYVATSEEDSDKMEERWKKWDPEIRVVTFVSRYRTIVDPMIEFIGRIEKHVDKKDTLIILLPEFLTKKWWHRLLHNQTASRIRNRLLREKEVVVATVPYHLRK